MFKGSKVQEPEQDSGADAHEAQQAIQNRNLLIALGGVARGATTHFPMSVSSDHFLFCC